MKAAIAPRTFLQGDGLKIWTNAGGSPNIVVLSHGSLYVSNIAPKDLNQAVNQLATGTGPEHVFGDHMRQIPLIAIEWAEADLRHNRFHFCYHAGLGHSKDTFQLAHAHDAKELLAILRQQLGDGYAVKQTGFNALRVFGGPLVAFFVHASVFAIAWLLVNPLDGMKHRSSTAERWLQDVVGESGLRMFGVSIATIIAIWALARILNRPAGTTFQKTAKTLS